MSFEREKFFSYYNETNTQSFIYSKNGYKMLSLLSSIRFCVFTCCGAWRGNKAENDSDY